ncbi:hypothetical protein KJY73_10410 [Bowmanella sp. Y26]|uniref:hypothetical protein n=1 Tax=Bowmanella yangjiangensis TaxID=2811230 RepID=UPI001BDD6F05|nr:hypothetical protein [Bowmanella yangjiangensis]MBT1063988.1 hypothetical protein [Bowmanella yangjiangensis]
MNQLECYADERLINGCIYCGARADTRDHVPSRILLESPYPENLPTVAACKACNQGFSKDEQYLVCLVESVIVGSTEPEKIKRPSVARAMERSEALRTRIESQKYFANERIIFNPEEERVRKVMLKLARGHSAFELSQPCRDEPDYFWCGPLEMLTIEQQQDFMAAHVQQLYGEIGSRNMQRMIPAEVTFKSESGFLEKRKVLVNDWIGVQEERYSYLAIDDLSGVTVRILVSNYLACEVVWEIYA